MTESQITAIKCAYADLVGAYQSYAKLDLQAHDWESHVLTLQDLEREFIFVEPVSETNSDQTTLPNIVISCSCGNSHIADMDNYIAIDQYGFPVRNHKGELEIYGLHEEATLNTSGNNKPIQIKNSPEEIQKEVKRQIKRTYNITQTNTNKP